MTSPAITTATVTKVTDPEFGFDIAEVFAMALLRDKPFATWADDIEVQQVIALLNTYAKSEQFASLEEFISAPNVGRIQDVAERCDGEAMHEAAKILFNSIANFARLATCLMHLGQH